MSKENSCMKKYPEWYRIERETEKTINRLTRSAELKFYLKSPDEHFRRLGILRVNHLKLKDSISILEEILDDSAETQINRDLAAWSIKSICRKWNIELFVSNRLIYKFTGNEKYQDIVKITIEDLFAPSQVSVSSSPITSRLGLDNYYNHQQNQDISFESYFSFEEWVQVCAGEFLTTGKQQIVRLPLRILTGLKNLIKKGITACVAGPKKLLTIRSLWNIKKLPNMLQDLLLNTLTNKKNKRNSSPKYPIANNYRGGKIAQLIILIRKTCYQILYILCYPIRLMIRNKTCTLAALIALYYVLTFTDTGMSFTKGRFGVSLIDVQNKFWDTSLMETKNEIAAVVKKVLLIAWVQINDIADWMYSQWIKEIRGK